MLTPISPDVAPVVPPPPSAEVGALYARRVVERTLEDRTASPREES